MGGCGRRSREPEVVAGAQHSSSGGEQEAHLRPPPRPRQWPAQSARGQDRDAAAAAAPQSGAQSVGRPPPACCRAALAGERRRRWRRHWRPGREGGCPAAARWQHRWHSSRSAWLVGPQLLKLSEEPWQVLYFRPAWPWLVASNASTEIASAIAIWELVQGGALLCCRAASRRWPQGFLPPCSVLGNPVSALANREPASAHQGSRAPRPPSFSLHRERVRGAREPAAAQLLALQPPTEA